jgi:hypothetical protein
MLLTRAFSPLDRGYDTRGVGTDGNVHFALNATSCVTPDGRTFIQVDCLCGRSGSGEAIPNEGQEVTTVRVWRTAHGDILSD